MCGGLKFSLCILDIDILIYDLLVGEYDGVYLLWDEIFINVFVLWLFSDVVVDELYL